jgi:hypothetical protein
MKRRVLLCIAGCIIFIACVPPKAWGDWPIRHWIAEGKKQDGCLRYAVIVNGNRSELVPIDDILKCLVKQSATTSRPLPLLPR